MSVTSSVTALILGFSHLWKRIFFSPLQNGITFFPCSLFLYAAFQRNNLLSNHHAATCRAMEPLVLQIHTKLKLNWTRVHRCEIVSILNSCLLKKFGSMALCANKAGVSWLVKGCSGTIGYDLFGEMSLHARNASAGNL